ncbi:MAG: hypothetical protein AB4426_22725 [Xenococcaceae cyanobacterium]
MPEAAGNKAIGGTKAIGNKGDWEQRRSGIKAIGLHQRLSICFNSRMKQPVLPIEIPKAERTPLVDWLLNLVAQQQQVIENQQDI